MYTRPITVHEHVGNSAYRTGRRSGQGNRYNGDTTENIHTQNEPSFLGRGRGYIFTWNDARDRLSDQRNRAVSIKYTRVHHNYISSTRRCCVSLPESRAPGKIIIRRLHV